MRSHSDVLLDLVYGGVLNTSPALYMHYEGQHPRHLGGTLRMIDGKVLTLDQRTKVIGDGLDDLAKQILEVMRPSFGFMATTRYFATSIDVLYSDIDDKWHGLAIWGVA